MKHTVSLCVILGAVWLLWSGHYEPLILGLGALSIVVVVYAARSMRLVDGEGVPVRIAPRILMYAPWLVWEVVKANVDVVRRILHPKLPVAPRVVHVRASQRSDLGRVIYANSITLTPGTVTVDVEKDSLVVHALSREAAEELAGGRMDRRVTALEGEA